MIDIINIMLSWWVLISVLWALLRDPQFASFKFLPIQMRMLYLPAFIIVAIFKLVQEVYSGIMESDPPVDLLPLDVPRQCVSGAHDFHVWVRVSGGVNQRVKAICSKCKWEGTIAQPEDRVLPFVSEIKE